MAKVGGFNLIVAASLVAGIAIIISGGGAQVGAQVGGALGGKIPIDDVKTNAEVQQLGRYCVSEYNKGLKMKRNPAIAAKMLSFSEVTKAEKQVVAGVKYYLRITAATTDSTVKTFDAEVVVGPGESSKELVTFAPSTLMRRK